MQAPTDAQVLREAEVLRERAAAAGELGAAGALAQGAGAGRAAGLLGVVTTPSSTRGPGRGAQYTELQEVHHEHGPGEEGAPARDEHDVGATSPPPRLKIAEAISRKAASVTSAAGEGRLMRATSRSKIAEKDV